MSGCVSESKNNTLEKNSMHCDYFSIQELILLSGVQQPSLMAFLFSSKNRSDLHLRISMESYTEISISQPPVQYAERIDTKIAPVGIPK